MAFVEVVEVNLKWIIKADKRIIRAASIVKELTRTSETAIGMFRAAIEISKALEPTTSMEESKISKALELVNSFKKEAQNSKAARNSLKLP